MAVDPIILEFRAETARLKKQIDGLDKEVNTLKKDSKSATDTMDRGFDKTTGKVKKTDREVGGLNKTFNTLATRVAAAFAVERIVAFGREAVKLAETAQGVEAAFNNIAGANLNKLREATRGTVSNLQLMQNAVQAQNLGLPIEELGNLFAFATQRARETGESVDFLTNSIVTGIGRKSPLILDNLGISAVALKEALGGVSTEAASVADVTAAVSRIIEGEMANAVDSGVSGSQRLSASLENLTVVIGQRLIPAVDEGSSSLAQLADDLTLALDENDLTFMQRFALIFQDLNPALDQVASATKIAANAQSDLDEEIRSTIDAIETYEERQKRLKETTSQSTPIIKTLKDELKSLNDELENATSQSEINSILERQIELQARINAIINQRTNIQDDSIDPELEIPTLPENPFGGLTEAQREALQESEDAWDEYYHNLTMMQVQNDHEQSESQRFLAEQDRMLLASRLEGAVGYFGALSQLAQASGERNKEFAIFEATINAALAITRAFAEGGISDPITRAIYVATVTTQTLAQIAAIKSQQVPSFYEGTDFVSNSPSKGRRRDDVAARLHYGEAVITAKANSRNKGLARALNKGNERDWIHSHHVLPALMAQKKEYEKQQKKDFATAITQSLALNMPDDRIVREVKRSRLVQQAILEAQKSNHKRNPYRA